MLNSTLGLLHSRAPRGGGGGGSCVCIHVSAFSSSANVEGPALSDVTSPSERLVRVCDRQMPGNHCRADHVAGWLRPGSLCSKVNYAS